MGEDMQKEIYYKILHIITAVFLVLLLFTLAVYNNNSSLKIVGTGVKDDISYGTDIRIQKILLNGVELNEKDITRNGEWIVENNSYTALNADDKTWLKIKIKKTDDLEVLFTKQEGSGYVDIELDGENISRKNLYSDIYANDSFFVFNSEGIGWIKAFVWILLLYGLILEIIWLNIVLKKIHIEKYIKTNDILLLVLGAVSVYISVEYLYNNLSNLHGRIVLENILLYFVFMAVIYIVTGMASLAIVTVSVIGNGFSLVNYFVTALRGTMLIPSDLYLLKTVQNVVGDYEFVITKYICISIVFAVFSAVTICYLSAVNNKKYSKTQRILLLLIVVVIFSKFTAFYKKPVTLWDVNNNPKKYGLVVTTAAMVDKTRVDKPENYSSEYVEANINAYKSESIDFSPNIIIIMDEAFSDLSVLNENIDSNLYMPYYNSLKEDTVKGYAMSSILGGSTSNAEWEMLTSNTMMFVPSTVPYMQFIEEDTVSITKILKERGYQTVAMHPYYASGYNRPRVYDNFGFDEFLDIEQFKDSDYIRDYVSDKSSYEKVIEIFENKQKDLPAFIFNVTMQNHGSYNYGYFDEELSSSGMLDISHSDALEYLSLVKKTDESISVLIDYFKNADEPTVILFFGDHQPKLEDAFYEDVFDKNTENFTSAEIAKMYQIPFFIWANYDIEEEEGVNTSINFLTSILFDKTGIETTEYQNYLLDLAENYPVVSRLGYVTEDGIYQTFGGIEYLPDELKEYWHYQYYYMFE